MKTDNIISIVSDFDKDELWNLYTIYKPSIRKKEGKIIFLNVIINSIPAWEELSETYEKLDLFNLKFRVTKLLEKIY